MTVVIAFRNNILIKVWTDPPCANSAILKKMSGKWCVSPLLGPLIAKLLLKGPTIPAHGVRPSVCVQKLNLRNYKV